jgi:ABC-type transport system substrate-binding protein/PKD repeat protein
LRMLHRRGEWRAKRIVAISLSVVLVSTVASILVTTRDTCQESRVGLTLSAGDRVLWIGWIDFQSQLASLNPLGATMSTEMAIIWPCYSTLLTYDNDSRLIGDLARSYSMSVDGLTWSFKLYESAQFYDRMNPPPPYGSGPVHPLTARDVIFTYGLIQNTTGSILNMYLPQVAGVPIVKNMSWGPGLYDLRITLSSAYAPFLSAVTSLPVLPMYIWSGRPWNWANYAAGIPPCVGSGFFYYNLSGLPTTGYVELVRSPTWLGTEEHGWQLKCNRLIYKSEPSPASSLSDFQNGLIDIMEWLTPDQYINSVPSIPGAVRQRLSSGFVYELNVNQMTNAMRAALGGQYASGTNNQLLLDPVVRLALSMSIDRDQFVDSVMQGLGSPADSFAPANHPYHYAYGSVPSDSPIDYDTSAARSLLMTSGWHYRLDGTDIVIGSPDYWTYYPLCKFGGSVPLRFRFYTLYDGLDGSPWNAGAVLIAQSAAAAGIDLWSYYGQKSMSFMNGAWFSADFDLWLWDWVFSPNSEISSDILNVMTTMAIGSWSDAYYSNSTYDGLYNQSLVTVNPVQRRVFTDQMQRMIYENHGSQAVAYKDDLFAMKASAPDYWTNWGNWSRELNLEPSQMYPWLFVRIEPQSNPAPIITAFDHMDCMVNISTSFTAAATDDSANLEYRWNFGDGTKTSWSSIPNATHTYSVHGYYTVDVMVRETGTLDGFMSSRRILVTVYDPGNSAPQDLDFTYVPLNPDTGTRVNFTGYATDPDGDPLTFSWDFGDGSIATGQNVLHQFVNGNSTVTMYVDDGYVGLEPRPVSTARQIVVTPNSPPTIMVPSNPSVIQYAPTFFEVLFTDNDPDDSHRFTWFWGDGNCSVTEVRQAVHTYMTWGMFNMTVFCDDLTGLVGHNVSDYGFNWVNKWPPGISPVIESFYANNTAPYVLEEITFSCLAIDRNDDILGYAFEFGDGTFAYFNATAGTVVSVQHAYASVGVYDAWVTVTDYQTLPVTSGPLTIEVSQWHFNLQLVQGWNFVAVPLVGNDYRASTLGLQYGDFVAGWNATAQSYDSTYIVGMSPPVKDFDIVPGVGYWIHASSAETLDITGALPTGTQTVSITVPPAGGWVAFAFLGLEIHYAHELPGMYSGSLRLVAMFDVIAHVYLTYIPGVPKDFAIPPGCAVWLFCTSSGTLAYTP